MEELKPYALISVSDKTGLESLAPVLIRNGFRLLSTGGTANFLTSKGFSVVDVGDYTGQASILDGRVKSLHPKIHAGILFDRKNPRHCEEIQKQNIESISLVIVNLYPFEQAREGSLPMDKAIELIDIGGPTILRAAAKNWMNCTTITDVQDYQLIETELSTAGSVSSQTRLKLAKKVFKRVSDYDAMISSYMNQELEASANQEHSEKQNFPEQWQLNLKKASDLRYGENPNQHAALYYPEGLDHRFIVDSEKQIQGKPLSYNNLLDLFSAWNLIQEFSTETACAIVKHSNPCGCATTGSNKKLAEIYQEALAGDPRSAFGGIVACNKTIDEDSATLMSEIFLECIAAPEFTSGALKVFAKKKNLRLVRLSLDSLAKGSATDFQIRSTGPMFLVQETDEMEAFVTWKHATTKQATEEEIHDMQFAMKVASHVKSNGIVFAKNRQCISIAGGHTSRIDAVDFAIQRARADGKELEGAVMASDAFFPFPDCVELAAKAGIAAIVQPGGSIKDAASIEAANTAGLAMILTNRRHFRH